MNTRQKPWTKGPWRWEEDTDPYPMRRLAPGILILDRMDGSGGPWGDEIDRANARLIAAGPELVDALEDCIDSLQTSLRFPEGWECSEEDLIGKARALLGRIYGETK
jgi:hypothetical protein